KISWTPKSLNCTHCTLNILSNYKRRSWSGGYFNKTDYSLWQDQLLSYFEQINASKYALTYLKKAIAYGKLVLQFHDSYECSNPSDCNKSYSWQRRIEITERILEKIEESLQTSDEGTLDKHPEFTTA